MLSVRQIFNSQELDSLKNAIGKIVFDADSKIDWSDLSAIKSGILDYKGTLSKKLNEFDRENYLLLLEKDLEVVLVLEEKLDHALAEDAANIKSIKERILNRLK